MSEDGTTPGGGGADKLARPWVLLALAALLAGAAALIVALAGGWGRPARPRGGRVGGRCGAGRRDGGWPGPARAPRGRPPGRARLGVLRNARAPRASSPC